MCLGPSVAQCERIQTLHPPGPQDREAPSGRRAPFQLAGPAKCCPAGHLSHTPLLILLSGGREARRNTALPGNGRKTLGAACRREEAEPGRRRSWRAVGPGTQQFRDVKPSAENAEEPSKCYKQMGGTISLAC